MSPHVRRLSLPIILAFVIALIACQASAAAPVPTSVPTVIPTDVTLPSPPPPNPGMTEQPATVFELTCKGPAIPQDAVISRFVRYPDPDTCNIDMDQTTKDHATFNLPVPSSPLPSVSTPSHASTAGFHAMSVPAQASIPGDTEWGWTMLNQNSRSGIQGQISAPWPYTFNPDNARRYSFSSNILPSNSSCLQASLLRLRHDPSLGSNDWMSFSDYCSGASLGWSLADPVAVQQFVRTDKWGSPVFYAVVEQTTLVGNCFRSQIYRYDINQYVNVQAKCGTGPLLQGHIATTAGLLETPTLYCPGALNPYMNALLKKNGAGNWVPITPSDTTFYSIGHCTAIVGPGHYAISGFYDSYGFWPIFLITPYP